MTNPVIAYSWAQALARRLLVDHGLGHVRVERLAPGVDHAGATDLHRWVRLADPCRLSTIIHEVAHVTSRDGDHGARWEAECRRLTPIAVDALHAMLNEAGPVDVASGGDG